MLYLNTRGAEQGSFADILLDSLAPQGGLWSPASVPAAQLPASDDLPAIAAALAAPWVSDWAKQEKLHHLFAKAWKDWAPICPPLTRLSDGLLLLELFHGHSLSFKDFGLSFLAACFEEELERREQRGVVLVATSGDTGAAAVQALSGLQRLQLVVLLPQGRISEVQRAQMTRGVVDNVHPLLVDGTFDDCQRMAKQCLNTRLLPDGYRFLSVNSINFGRLLAQLAYFHACARTLDDDGTVFAVPSGNFGNAYAASLAQRGGAAIDKVLVACNDNNSLHRFISSGSFQPGSVQQTLSSAMDIALPSNLERLLFECADRDYAKLQDMGLSVGDSVKIDASAHAALQRSFVSSAHSDSETLAQIQRVHDEDGRVIDPHTGVAVAAARTYMAQNPGHGQVVAVAPAHPCKFPEVMKEAGLAAVPLPDVLRQQSEQPERYVSVPNAPEALQQYIQEQVVSG